VGVGPVDELLGRREVTVVEPQDRCVGQDGRILRGELGGADDRLGRLRIPMTDKLDGELHLEIRARRVGGGGGASGLDLGRWMVVGGHAAVHVRCGADG
jgi:hypothetical protein